MKAKIQGAEGDKKDSIINESITLCTKGAKATVTLNPAPSKSITKFSNKSLDELQIHLNNISNKHIKNIAQWLRVHGGRSSVEPGFANHISKKGQTLSNNYKLSYHTFEEGEGKSDKPVIWAKAEDLLAAIADAREIVGPSLVKAMADGGQGFKKYV